VHPALSIVVFTVSSGVGYGLLAWIGLLAPIGALPLTRQFGTVSLLLALGFITAGLLSSTLHLGHPERAWRAISQWRSSWLSREGMAAIATYVPALTFAALWLFDGTGKLWSACGVLAAAGSIVTVICTAMIYRSLKPIRQWDNHWVLPSYVVLAAMTGALWLAAVVAALDVLRPAATALSAALLIAAAAVKLAYWRSIEAGSTASTLASATGLPPGRTIRVLDEPHTEENYLLREMGYRIARRHAAKLRRIAVGGGFLVPLVLLVLAWLLRGGAASAVLALAAAAAATAGVLVERWLFFAEATHTVALYYRGEAGPSARSAR
jgi:sulfite dehydrogenase (quinone) subunit SoeC